MPRSCVFQIFTLTVACFNNEETCNSLFCGETDLGPQKKPDNTEETDNCKTNPSQTWDTPSAHCDVSLQIHSLCTQQSLSLGQFSKVVTTSEGTGDDILAKQMN